MRDDASVATWSDADVLEGVTEALVGIEADWQIGYLNDEAARLLCRPQAQLLGHCMWDVYAELRGSDFEAQLRRVHDERRPASFVNHYAPFGRWFSVRASPARGGIVLAFHDVTEQKRAEQLAQELATEREALRRIADLLAREVPRHELFHHAAEEAAKLQRSDGVAIVRRLEGSSSRVVVGSWAQDARIAVGIEAVAIADELVRTARPVVMRAQHGELAELHRATGLRALLQVPIVVERSLWGAVVVASRSADAFDERAVRREREFAAMLGMAIFNADAHEQLARIATTDALTGLSNHRVFHESLRAAVVESGVHGRPLALGVLDLDRFRDVNDMHGHLVGDRILRECGQRVAAVLEPGQLLARIGGDEFGLLLPGLTAARADAVLERARAAIARTPFAPEDVRLTASAGVADLTAAGHGELLFACADGALYWTKLHGRDSTSTFHPALLDELAPADRTEALLRTQTLAGILALARAIDAKDPLTSRHSERVAWLAEMLARECGWSDRDSHALHEAALVHDVGKIGVPDAILLREGPLTGEQRAVVQRHAALGAEIVEGVLSAEQVGWVRSHHERPDGRGYPEGLVGDRISAGAALLAVADVVDVMTLSRPYSAPITLSDALVECRRLVGTQLCAAPVAALERLHTAGALSAWELPR